MTSTIFFYIAIIATVIFLIQFIVSIFFGDMDTDMDAGVNVDVGFDLGSMLSFKGLTHFCMGMGWYMYITGGTTIFSYAIGLFIGLLFVVILWFLYKKAYQLQKERKPEKTADLFGRECTVYMQNGDRLVVQIAVNGALRELDVRSLGGKKYLTGDRVTICKIEEGTIYIQ